VPVTSELCVVVRNWTGVETQFITGFKASQAVDVVVTTALDVTLTRGLHYTSSLDINGNLVVSPLGGMLAAPQTLTITRSTPAVQPDTIPVNDTYSPVNLERRLNEGAMRDAELKNIVAAVVADVMADLARAALRPANGVDGSSYYDAKGNRFSGAGAPLLPTDLIRWMDVAAAQSVAGAVPVPIASQKGYPLRAIGAASFNWALPATVWASSYIADSTGLTAAEVEAAGAGAVANTITDGRWLEVDQSVVLTASVNPRVPVFVHPGKTITRSGTPNMTFFNTFDAGRHPVFA
jgi:stage V sporulation protein SpoVS